MEATPPETTDASWVANHLIDSGWCQYGNREPKSP